MSTRTVESAIDRGWWIFLLRGILGVALGIIALVFPAAALGAVVLLVGSFLVVDGIFAIVKAFQVFKSSNRWWLLLLAGIASIVAGGMIFAWPGLSILLLVYFVAGWAIVTGVLEIGMAIEMRKVITGEWLYVLFGVISIAFGILVYIVPHIGLTYIVLMIALYGFMSGIAMFALAFRLRNMRRRLPRFS